MINNPHPSAQPPPTYIVIVIHFRGRAISGHTGAVQIHDVAQCAKSTMGSAEHGKEIKRDFSDGGGGGGARYLVSGIKGAPGQHRGRFFLLHKAISASHPNMVIMILSLIPPSSLHHPQSPSHSTGAPGCVKRQVISFYIVCYIKNYILAPPALAVIASSSQASPRPLPFNKACKPFFASSKGSAQGWGVGYLLWVV
jgi:hypothetical protein